MIRLVNATITSYVYKTFCVVRSFKIYSISNIQMYNTALLTIVTMLYSSKLIHLVTEGFYSDHFCPFSHLLSPTPTKFYHIL